MPYSTKVVTKAADPHAQARFWSLALGWVPEDNSGLITGLLQAGGVAEADTLMVDGVLSFRTIAALRDPDADVDPRSGAGLGGRMLFELGSAPGPTADEPGNVRFHLDIHVGPQARPDHVAALLAAGATHLWDVDENGSSWVTLADPEGNPLCVA